MTTRITKHQAIAYISRGEHDWSLTYFDFYETIRDLHKRIEELEGNTDHRPCTDDQHKLIANWGM